MARGSLQNIEVVVLGAGQGICCGVGCDGDELVD